MSTITPSTLDTATEYALWSAPHRHRQRHRERTMQFGQRPTTDVNFSFGDSPRQ